VDVRLIAATNRDLKRLVAESRFRDDLYYRLNTFPIEIPPLRERLGDIPILAEMFLKRSAAKLGKAPPALAPEALDLLKSYSWPGNVRELENMMERTAILSGDRVEAADLPLAGAGPPRPVRWEDIERHAIEEALAANGGSRTLAARQLGISLRTLQYRLKSYNLPG
jgi:transcriptional regulator with GAF, ATPase, and Fis domain